MELYVRFISTLAFGLVGLGAVLKILLENVFEDWDAVREIADSVAAACSSQPGHLSRIEAEDALLEAEEISAPVGSTRLVDQRRRQMKEMDAVETRLGQVQAMGNLAELDILPS
jgi:hypothetical protein